MRLIPSRRWVKETIPAFLCCETSPWASLWIRFYIWLCPECRREFASLKQIWDELDHWEVDLPSENLEDQFSHTFRAKFPSAFQGEKEPALPRTGDVVLRMAYTCAILVLGVTIFMTQERTTETIRPIAARNNHPSFNSPLAKNDLSFEKTAKSSTRVAQGSSPSASSPSLDHSDSGVSLRGAGPLWGEDSVASHDFQVLRTSTGPLGSEHTHPSLARLKRTIQINHFPITGFETLLAAEEDRSY